MNTHKQQTHARSLILQATRANKLIVEIFLRKIVFRLIIVYSFDNFVFCSFFTIGVATSYSPEI